MHRSITHWIEELHVLGDRVWDDLQTVLIGFLGLKVCPETQVAKQVEQKVIAPCREVSRLRPAAFIPFLSRKKFVPTINVLGHEGSSSP